jgi:hypothetical protein
MTQMTQIPGCSPDVFLKATSARQSRALVAQRDPESA